ncbi:MAG: copper-translocating P-type ATPase [Clostridia bacterium]|nr:copper-translocating P-type ATPase [Clostridia bacterium]MBQ7897828.1 copper-translocating P-type ATPase [Clostridia bacterium]
MQKKFNVEGMSCSACSASVERAVGKIEGVNSASVDLLSKTLICDFDEKKVTADTVINAVSKAGFSATLKEEKKAETKKEETKEDYTPVKTRLIVSFIFLFILMYVSMGHMLSLPEPPFFKGRENALTFAFTQLLLTLPVIYVNRKFFFTGIKALKNGAPNMDTLVAIGSLAGAVYGVFAIYMIGYGQGHGQWEIVDTYRHNLYFESSAMILTLVTLGKFFESRSKDRTGDALRGLESLSPEKALVERGGTVVEILTSEIQVGDTVIVRPGSRVPIDGVITDGGASFDTSALTGESVPVFKSVGDEIASASLSLDGEIKIKATGVGKDTTLSKIIELVEGAGASKAPIARLADKISRVFVPTVMTIALVTFGVWMLLGEGFEFSLSRALSVLVISCPCALGLATPVAITVSVGRLAREGILVKSASFAESLAEVKIAIFDKTGTVTEGKMSVSDVSVKESEKEFFLSLVKTLEEKSDHPLALAMTEYTSESTSLEITDFKAVAGKGVEGKIDGKEALGGNLRFMKEKNIDISSLEKIAEGYAEEGKTATYFALDGKALGVVAISDTVKADAKSTIEELKRLGIKTVLLTGDNSYTAKAVGSIAGFDEVISDVLPQDKQRVVKEYRERGRTLMVGDGINDSPALATADVGMAIGTGTDIAIDASDIILMSGGLHGVLRCVTYAKATVRNIKQNLFWAFFYNALGIPLAAGVLFYPLGIVLNPMIGAAAMSFSSVFVVTNALRLYKK